ncbi:KilA-N domain-containing protein [Chromobacterium haemolyticum]|uniref:KilA-N domain-containing protein n=1 Tax=Chromobacterium haemolyticum TaxID=394935 RepID=UPI0002E6F042|nr:KilA-N domain-containing protein [Chromobacterium haemolyticum]
MAKLIQVQYQGLAQHFTADAWFNATRAAGHFGKEPSDWLHQRDTVDYLAALAQHQGNSEFVQELNKISTLPSTSGASRAKLLKLAKQTGFVRSKPGNPDTGGGTWLHPKLATAFARWLDVRFAIWCDEQIDQLIRGASSPESWTLARHDAGARFRGVCDMVNLSRMAAGKSTAQHHYSNEARLLNWVLTGQFDSVDRDRLSKADLRLLELLEAQDMVLLGMGKSYDERKHDLLSFAQVQRQRLAANDTGRLSA